MSTETTSAAPAPSEPPARPATATAVSRLTVASVLITLVGVVTGPLQAHALGPVGRGDVAAVLVPTSLAAWLGHLGLGHFISREVAAAPRRTAEVLGSAGALLAGSSLLVLVAAAPLAILLADGDPRIRWLLVVGLCLTPLALAKQAVYDVNVGMQRWTAAAAIQVIPPGSFLVVVVVLYVADELTVTSAAITGILGVIVSVLPGLPALRGTGRPHVRAATVRAAARFGSRAWLSELLNLTNGRLDQLLMIPLVPRRELGLYVVAVTVAQAAGLLTSVASTLLLPRVGAGDRAIVPRVVRCLLATTALAGVVVAVLIPFVIEALFGDDFGGATKLVWVLLVAGVPLAGTTALTAAVNGAGRPGLAARAQLLSVGITVPGLLVSLPLLGAMGAALTSLAAYGVSFSYLLLVARGALGFRLRDALVPRTEDGLWLVDVVRRRLARTR